MRAVRYLFNAGYALISLLFFVAGLGLVFFAVAQILLYMRV
jgi:hypothetical protein